MTQNHFLISSKKFPRVSFCEAVKLRRCTLLLMVKWQKIWSASTKFMQLFMGQGRENDFGSTQFAYLKECVKRGENSWSRSFFQKRKKRSFASLWGSTSAILLVTVRFVFVTSVCKFWTLSKNNFKSGGHRNREAETVQSLDCTRPDGM